MKNPTRTLVALSALSLVVVFAIASTALSDSRYEPSPQQEDSDSPAGPPWQNLDCPAGDFTIVDISEIDDNPGGFENPRDALNAFLVREFDQLDSSRFDERYRESATAEYTLTDEATERGAALVERIGDSWHVTVFTVCESVSTSGTEP